MMMTIMICRIELGGADWRSLSKHKVWVAESAHQFLGRLIIWNPDLLVQVQDFDITIIILDSVQALHEAWYSTSHKSIFVGMASSKEE